MGIDGDARAADTPATHADNAAIETGRPAIETTHAAIIGVGVAKAAFKTVSTLAVPSDRAPAPLAGAFNP